MAFLRKIPEKIHNKLVTFTDPSIHVGCSLSLTANDIKKLDLNAVGIKVEKDDILVCDKPVLPPPTFGCVSRENLSGKEIVLKNKVRKLKEIYLGERPIYGDWSKGSFSLFVPRLVYQRMFIPPKGMMIKVQNLGLNNINAKWDLVFTIEPSLLKTDDSFANDLLYALSLLHEITGIVDVFPSKVKPSDIIKSRHLDWDVFPPGQRNFRNEVARRISDSNNKDREAILSRANVIESLNPREFVFGNGLASNYYGALLANDLVVFENLGYGNATYILFENWEKLSKMSRSELLMGNDKYHRIFHGSNWASNLKTIVFHEMNRRNDLIKSS